MRYITLYVYVFVFVYNSFGFGSIRWNATQWLCTLKMIKSTTATMTATTTATKIMGCLWTVTKKRETNWCRFHLLPCIVYKTQCNEMAVNFACWFNDIFAAITVGVQQRARRTHMTTWWSDRRQKRIRWVAKMAIICLNWVKYVMNSNFLSFFSFFLC